MFQRIVIGPATWWTLVLALVLGAGVGVGFSPVADAQEQKEAEDHGTEAGAEHGAEADHGSEAGHGAEEPNILAFEPGLAFYTLIVFLITLAVLWYFAWGPLADALHRREHRLQEQFEEAERARKEAASLLEQHRQQMEQVQDEVRKIMDEANQKAQAAYDERLKKAQADAENTLNRAHREIGSAKQQALAEIFEQSANVAVNVASRVLQRELSDDDQRRLIHLATEELQTVEGSNGRGDSQR